jgi:UDP-N-acetyl-D-glucosamine 4,6-dehydratase
MRELLRPTALKRIIFFIISDLLLSIVSLYSSYLLRFNFHIVDKFLDTFWVVFTVLVVLKIGFMYILKSYKIIWRFFGLYEAKNIVIAHIGAYMSFVVIYLLLPNIFNPFPRSVIAIDFFLSLILIGALRISKRVVFEGHGQIHQKPTLIIGVNSTTPLIIQSAMKSELNYYPIAIVAFVDDNAEDMYINNIKVYSYDKISYLASKYHISSAIITQKLSKDKLKVLVDTLNSAGINEIKKIQLLDSDTKKLEDISIEDLLAREPKDLDTKVIQEFIQNKTILITGAGGSIGSEISRQCQAYGAKELILLDNSEYNLYQISQELPKAQIKLLNILDIEELEGVFNANNIDVVIHAAAYKHVPICEVNIHSAIKNNIIGSKNVIDLSIKYKASKIVIISTDKAVRPTNVMGATKRVVELYAQNVPSGDSEIVAVRFGNVLGSSGSVVPKFKEQILSGGPVTVTHPEITRYFMLIPEACLLVLQAASIAKGGELFVLDMGKPVKIADLARQMIRLYGKENEVDIEFVGLREGEKLYEELLLDESDKETKYSSIFIAKPTKYDYPQLLHDIDLLLQNNNHIEILKKIVLEFTHK